MGGFISTLEEVASSFGDLANIPQGLIGVVEAIISIIKKLIEIARKIIDGIIDIEKILIKVIKLMIKLFKKFIKFFTSGLIQTVDLVVFVTPAVLIAYVSLEMLSKISLIDFTGYEFINDYIEYIIAFLALISSLFVYMPQGLDWIMFNPLSNNNRQKNANIKKHFSDFVDLEEFKPIEQRKPKPKTQLDLIDIGVNKKQHGNLKKLNEIKLLTLPEWMNIVGVVASNSGNGTLSNYKKYLDNYHKKYLNDYVSNPPKKTTLAEYNEYCVLIDKKIPKISYKAPDTTVIPSIPSVPYVPYVPSVPYADKIPGYINKLPGLLNSSNTPKAPTHDADGEPIKYSGIYSIIKIRAELVYQTYINAYNKTWGGYRDERIKKLRDVFITAKILPLMRPPYNKAEYGSKQYFNNFLVGFKKLKLPKYGVKQQDYDTMIKLDFLGKKILKDYDTVAHNYALLRDVNEQRAKQGLPPLDKLPGVVPDEFNKRMNDYFDKQRVAKYTSLLNWMNNELIPERDRMIASGNQFYEARVKTPISTAGYTGVELSAMIKLNDQLRQGRISRKLYLYEYNILSIQSFLAGRSNFWVFGTVGKLLDN